MTKLNELPSMIEELERLRVTAPKLESCDLTSKGVQDWLTRAKAAILAVAGTDEARAYQLYIDELQNPKLRASKAVALRGMIPRNLERAERKLVFDEWGQQGAA